MERTNLESRKSPKPKSRAFGRDLGPFVVAAETTRMAMVFTDAKGPDHPIIFVNDSFLSLTGYDREEVLGQSFNFLMARGADPEVMAQVEAAFDGSTDQRPGNSLPPQGWQHVLGRHLHQPGSG